MAKIIKCDFEVFSNRKLLDFIGNSILRVIFWCRCKIRIWSVGTIVGDYINKREGDLGRERQKGFCSILINGILIISDQFQDNTD